MSIFIELRKREGYAVFEKDGEYRVLHRGIICTDVASASSVNEAWQNLEKTISEVEENGKRDQS